MCNAGYDWIFYHSFSMCHIESYVPVENYQIFGEIRSNELQIGGSLRQKCLGGTNHKADQQVFCNWHYDIETGEIEAYWSGEINIEHTMCLDIDECQQER